MKITLTPSHSSYRPKETYITFECSPQIGETHSLTSVQVRALKERVRPSIIARIVTLRAFRPEIGLAAAKEICENL
jgi:hypothetical protein